MSLALQHLISSQVYFGPITLLLKLQSVKLATNGLPEFMKRLSFVIIHVKITQKTQSIWNFILTRNDKPGVD